jgi:hypothetical protein
MPLLTTDLINTDAMFILFTASLVHFVLQYITFPGGLMDGSTFYIFITADLIDFYHAVHCASVLPPIHKLHFQFI